MIINLMTDMNKPKNASSVDEIKERISSFESLLRCISEIRYLDYEYLKEDFTQEQLKQLKTIKKK